MTHDSVPIVPFPGQFDQSLRNVLSQSCRPGIVELKNGSLAVPVTHLIENVQVLFEDLSKRQPDVFLEVRRTKG